MKPILRVLIAIAALFGMFVIAGCEAADRDSASRPATPPNSGSAAPSNANTAAPPAAVEPATKPQNGWAVTLPVLDAFLGDETFTGELKSNLQLTDEQVNKLKATSHEATSKLRELGRERTDDDSNEANLRQQAEREIGAVIGPEKVTRLFDLVADRWNGNAATAGGESPAAGGESPAAGAAPPAPANAVGVPHDTRIVVNDPAFRMDVFENGTLIKSYKIGIGYPEFPLPTGLRKASTIIFNPTWTPPDEPWVESGKSKAEVGKLVEAGDKLNPLGALKIPIGLPSLIHGGKSPAKIGNFASHGCVGLTDSQAKGFAKVLAHLGGVELTDDQIAKYGQNKTETKTVTLSSPIPVELRYETITVEDGKLHIYRDVYDRGTNTEQNLRAALALYGVTLEQLSSQERAQAISGLEQMSRDASGTTTAHDGTAGNTNRAAVSSKHAAKSKPSGAVTRVIKGQKEVVVEIAALAGKGYPAAVDLDTGSSAQPAKATRNNRGKPRK